MRWIVLLASLVIQACLGSVYAWSVFVPQLEEAYRYTSAQTQLVFSLAIVGFVICMIPAGWLQDRIGPRFVALIGGVLFGSGYLVGSWGAGTLGLLVGGVGLLQGAGIGFGYVCPLATCVKWFPNIQGLVTGVSVAGFGGGAIIMTFLAERFMTTGVPVDEQFWYIGVFYGLLIVVGALFLQVPPGYEPAHASGEDQPIAAIVRRPGFWALFIGMLTGTFAGLLVIGNLKSIGLALSLSDSTAAAGVSVLAAGNAVGRVVWGKFFDHSGMRTIPVSLGWLCLGVLLLAGAPHGSVWLYFVACIVIGTGFGACFVLYASAISQIHGPAKLGSIYPWVFSAYGLAALLGPPLGGTIKDVTDHFTLAIVVAAAICLVGLVLFPLLNRRHPARFGIKP